MSAPEIPPLRIGLPKGRMQDGVLRLFADAGIQVRIPERGYRPGLSLSGFEAKILKPQNIVEMLHMGSRDIGFAGFDWVSELQADVVELLDTGLDPVSLVAAAPPDVLANGGLKNRQVVVSSEFERLTQVWIHRCGLDAVFIRSYGATEVFPPEDADCIVDISATGDTLRQNGLRVFDILLESSTRLYANPRALSNPGVRSRCKELVMILQSVLDARYRVMLEVNVSRTALEQVIGVLPCMRCPTVAPLDGDDGFAVKAAVPRLQLPGLIPKVKRAGGTDIVITALQQIVP